MGLQMIVGGHFVTRPVVAKVLSLFVRLPSSPAEWRSSCPQDILEVIRRVLLILRMTTIWPVLADGTYLYMNALYRFDGSATFHSKQKKRPLSKVRRNQLISEFFFVQFSFIIFLVFFHFLIKAFYFIRFFH